MCLCEVTGVTYSQVHGSPVLKTLLLQSFIISYHISYVIP